MDWLDLLAIQGTLKSLLQHHSSKASILWCLAFFIVQLSHPYMTTGKTIALTRWTFVGKVMSLLFNMLSRLVITFMLVPYLLMVLTASVMTPRFSSTIPFYTEPRDHLLKSICNSNMACLTTNWYLPPHLSTSLISTLYITPIS